MTAAPHGGQPVPRDHEAHEPPEARGLARDRVRMLVAGPAGMRHRVVRDLPDELRPGDLLVLNTSATLPAALPLVGPRWGQLVHVSGELDTGDWVVEVRASDKTGPAFVSAGEEIRLAGGLSLLLAAPHPPGQHRLWRAVPLSPVERLGYLAEHGRPIRYPYVRSEWPLEALQNVYADVPGSAEMPSAGRPLSADVLVRLVSRGVVVAPVVLHTGVSSQEKPEPPQPEEFTVPEATARLVASTRGVGRRVVAVGTTVVRALESAADRRGRVHPVTGWTDLVLGPDRAARVVDGMLTGLHEPGASHRDLLRAVAGRTRVEAAYQEATDGPVPYLWHEFGDTMLLLR